MNTNRLRQMAADEAWKEVQTVYILLYGPEETSPEDKYKAKKALERANEWLMALKG